MIPNKRGRPCRRHRWYGKELIMRKLQIGAFLLGLIAFVTSAFFAGSTLGDIFWRAGLAIVLSDIVLIMLWPARPAA